MKLSVVALALAALMTVHAVAAKPMEGRALLKAAHAQGHFGAKSEGEKTFVKAEGSATSTGGKSSATAFASAAAFAKAKDASAAAFATAIAEVKGGKKAVAAADAAALAVATAIARAYAEAYAAAESDGSGNSACAKAFASAEATAKAFAEAFAEGVAIAANKHNVAKAVVDASAIAVATAKAFAQAEAAVCVYGKAKAVAFQQTFAESIVKAYALAVVKALAAVHGNKATAKVDAFADSYTKEKNFAFTNGAATTISDGGVGEADAAGVAFAKGGPSCYTFSIPVRVCCRHKICHGYYTLKDGSVYKGNKHLCLC